MNLALLFLIPFVLFVGLGVVLVLVAGLVLPWLAEIGFGPAKELWFQALVKMILLVLGVVMPIASLLTWMERKESAMMQDRVGPNRAAILGIRAYGIIHFVTDAIKMIMKEDFVPSKANRWLFTLAPVMAVVPVLVIFCIIPFGSDVCTEQLFEVVKSTTQCEDGKVATMQVARLDVGMLFYFAIASLAVYGTTLAGWSSYNKWSLLGGLRASSQMMSYEVTMGMAILGAFLVYGTLEPYAIAQAQGPNVAHWGIVTQPLGALLFFTAAIAETKRTPFDTPEGENEVIGYFVEYSGMRFGMFFLNEYAGMTIMSMVSVTLFFGGWMGPWAEAIQFWGVSWIGLVWFLVKTYVLVFALVWIRLSIPRLQVDQLMAFAWKVLIPLGLVNILATAAVILWVPSWKWGLAVFSWIAFFAFVGLLDPLLKLRLRRQRRRQPVVSA